VQSLEGAPGQTAVAFHVSDLRLDGTSPSEQRLQCRRQSAFGPCDQNRGLFQVMSQ
jgi:hypothetical protein